MWTKNDKRNPITQDMGEVLAFHPNWIDEDFNPDVIRAGYFNGDDKFYSAKWFNYHDNWESCDKEMPTLYMLYPTVDPNQRERRNAIRSFIVVMILVAAFAIYRHYKLFHP